MTPEGKLSSGAGQLLDIGHRQGCGLFHPLAAEENQRAISSDCLRKWINEHQVVACSE